MKYNTLQQSVWRSVRAVHVIFATPMDDPTKTNQYSEIGCTGRRIVNSQQLIYLGLDWRDSP